MFLKGIYLLYIISNAAANSILDCSFESNLCTWSNDPDNWDLNWIRTPMDKLGMIDSNIVEKGGVCLVSSKLSSKGVISSRLWSKPILISLKLRCLSFKYRFNEGIQSGLTLIRREMKKNLQIWNTSERIESTHDTKFNEWIHARVDIAESNDYKLILEGKIHSEDSKATICVDNITSSTEPCTSELQVIIPGYDSWVNIFAWPFFGALIIGIVISIAVISMYFFERIPKRRKANQRIIRHADELDLTEGITTAYYDDTNPTPQRYLTSQRSVGLPIRGSQLDMVSRRNSEQMIHIIGDKARSGHLIEQYQQGSVIENNDYISESDYTTCRENITNKDNEMTQEGDQPMLYQNSSIPQVGISNYNPFETPVITGINYSRQPSRLSNDCRTSSFLTEESRATPVLPNYPPRYEEAMQFNRSLVRNVNEKPSLLPPRMPRRSENFNDSAYPSIPMSSLPNPPSTLEHPNAGLFTNTNQQYREDS